MTTCYYAPTVCIFQRQTLWRRVLVALRIHHSAWNDPRNWKDGRVPKNGDDLIIKGDCFDFGGVPADLSLNSLAVEPNYDAVGKITGDMRQHKQETKHVD